MTAEKKERAPRRRLTDADRLAELKDRAERDQQRADASSARYELELRAAHQRAKELAAALPPLPKPVAAEPAEGDPAS